MPWCSSPNPISTYQIWILFVHRTSINLYYYKSYIPFVYTSKYIVWMTITLYIVREMVSVGCHRVSHELNNKTRPIPNILFPFHIHLEVFLFFSSRWDQEECPVTVQSQWRTMGRLCLCIRLQTDGRHVWIWRVRGWFVFYFIYFFKEINIEERKSGRNLVISNSDFFRVCSFVHIVHVHIIYGYLTLVDKIHFVLEVKMINM